ncbi:hypothetical protein QFC22_002227 [Naganishia vaughanmartiniae]|uniref:Uncharacterized protein n=1 Tax=Naganishia vaughanmartiniae TaxID=1424756 RepID=A0ACC2XDB8_9TREE|nr:hypothetical protein QFC22_002227 [Naganishia vaughanmartiniae]
MATPPPPAPPAAAESGLHQALRYTGVPPSVLKWRPRLPSKKMAVFLTLVGSGTYAYWYDRKECARIKEEYVQRVAHLAKVPMEGSLAFGRKVTVYAAKWPEDDDYERGLKYFKRYVKVSRGAVGVKCQSGRSRGRLLRRLDCRGSDDEWNGRAPALAQCWKGNSTCLNGAGKPPQGGFVYEGRSNARFEAMSANA